MKKTFIYLFLFLILVVTLGAIGRLTNSYLYFTATTTANYPTIKVGDKFFASNLLSPKRFDFICYNAETEIFGKYIGIHRLCGLEGDKMEIKKGILYINDKNVDSNLPLAHDYLISMNDLSKIKKFEKIDESSIQQVSEDTIFLYVSDKAIKETNIKATKRILPKESPDKDGDIKKHFNGEWNADNFGPVVVPNGKFFVLGDNRGHSRDSRFLGFIEKTKFIATVIGNK